ALVDALMRAAAAVQKRFGPDTVLKVGDVSAPQGGLHPRHGSHRSGRDVDLIFYARDGAGRPVRGSGWLAYDRFGVAVDRRAPGQVFFFDEARNWALVRALLADPHIEVQWIFCSAGIKALLLRHAMVHEPDAAVLARAAWVLHQPGRGNPHRDHFHVRIACPPRDRAQGCEDGPPLWPWLRRAQGRDGAPVAELSEAGLVRALLRPASSSASATGKLSP
ncbi:MAG: penicillin-insensitive murein endopeptidase, partial [Polyangiales bacterium]